MKAIVLAGLLAVVTSHAFAQLRWEKVNLPSTTPFQWDDIDVSPRGVVYYTHVRDSLLHRSYDEGASWQSVQLPNHFSISFIDDDGNLYGTYGSTLRRSSDDGTSWTMDTLPSPFTQFLLGAWHNLYLFTYGPAFYQSTDLGRSWGPAEVHPEHMDLGWSGAACSPDGNVFGFFSYDCSATMLRGTRPGQVRTMFGIVLDNSPVSWMQFALDGYGYAFQSRYSIRSSNRGETWVPVDSSRWDDPTAKYRGPYGILKSGSLLGVRDSSTALSTDHGDTWNVIGPGVSVPDGVKWSSPTPRGTFFVIADSGVYRTTFFADVRSESQDSPTITLHGHSLSIHDASEGSLAISDILGRVVMRTTIRDRVDLTGLRPGSYFALYRSANGAATLKFRLGD